jgi:large subunit ribosomal protein L3
MKKVNPRHGSMQVWPRKRAKKLYPRIRSRPKLKDALPIGFAGYKVGMTNIIGIDSYKNSITKGQEINVPVTIIECPALRIHSIRFYKPHGYGVSVAKEFFLKGNKFVSKKVKFKPSPDSDLDKINPDDYSKITITLSTQPHLIKIKKTPEIFELPLGGNNADVIEFVKSHKDSGIKISELFKEGDLVDLHAITKGKGTQGPVKRFGVSIRSHKSEKNRRGPGSLAGSWKGQGHMMWRVAYSGQMGVHQRTQYNSQIYKISDNPKEIIPKGDFLKYGKVNSEYILVKGSVPGAKKRLIVFTKAIRPPKNTRSVPTIEEINLNSKQ